VDLAVISYSSYLEALPWIEAVQMAKTRYVIVVQGTSETLWPADDIAERLSIAFENAACAYFVSEGNRKLFRQQLNTPLKRSRVIRNPFGVRYDAQPPWPDHPSDRLSLACVARLDIIQKSQDILLSVLSLAHWRERDVHVALVGDGPHQRSLRRMAEIEKLSNVEFTGFVDDIEGLWARHHALVLPSRFEGMPIALVEAMLCGRAAIMTDVAGHRELVCDGVNGFMAKAPTVELLDEAMNRAWENRGRLREMGARAARDVRQWVSADPVEDFVRELTAIVDYKSPAQA
jgi:glycosyltransferase involved in cell wall biosynthesis